MRRQDDPDLYEEEKQRIGRRLAVALLAGPVAYARASEEGRQFRLRWEESLPGDEEAE